MILRGLLKIGKGVHLGLVYIQKTIAVIVFFILTAAMFAEVVARYFIGQGFFAAEDFIGYTAVWLYFIGAALATRERTQIKADIINLIFKSQRVLNICRAAVAAYSVVVASVLTWWSYVFVRLSISRHEKTPVYNVPFVYFQSAILVGSVLMALYFLTELIDHTRQIYRKASVPGVSGVSTKQEARSTR